jgi:hypothetical protein
MTSPRYVLVIRHVDKDTDHPDFQGASKAGLARANFWGRYFSSPRLALPRPEFIYAFNVKGSLVNRAVQAVNPLIDIAHIPLSTDYTNSAKQTEAMALAAMSRPDNCVLIVWEHHLLPSVVQKIGDVIAKRQNLSSNPFSKFRGWCITPWTGAVDDDLYSLLLLIDTEKATITAWNQSNHFSDDASFLFPDPNADKELFTLPSSNVQV